MNTRIVRQATAVHGRKMVGKLNEKSIVMRDSFGIISKKIKTKRVFSL